MFHETCSDYMNACLSIFVPIMFRKNILFVLIVVIICATRHITAHRLNVPRVLLPVFNNFAVNFTLEVTDGGCYQWSTSRLDIIQLIPINENVERSCSSAVLIQTITREPTRNTAIVLAEEIHTGHFLRCDVIVDAIFSLNLVTTTRELYIEEAPEAFEVRAYDEQGNEFSTLAGVEFLWILSNVDKHMSSDNKPTNDVLRFMTYEESQYERPITVSALDIIGKRGHIVLLEGVRTGTAKVSVRLPHSEYKHVPSIKVELIVIANLIIIPSEITIMAHDSFKYKIMQARQGRLEEISLPSSQYYLEAENSDILEIDNEHDVVYARKLGRTKVFLHDKNVREEYPVILPSATVNIHDVAYISFSVQPNRNWGLVLGHVHEIIVELYDNKDHKFHIGEGVEISMKIDEQYFDAKLITQNGSYAVGVPINCGVMIVEATLYGIINKHGKKIVFTSQPSIKAELLIHTPIKIQPQILVIPWDSNPVKSISRFDTMLKAKGGDGSYIWSSRQPSVVTVYQNGSIKILSTGSAEIVAAMAKNAYNKDTAKVYVLKPTKLKIIEYNREAAVGETIYLHVALFGKLINGSDVREIPFNDCKDIDFKVSIPNGNFLQNYNKDVQPLGIACAIISTTSLDIGTSDVIVSYNVDQQYLQDNVTISAYKPLTSIHPESKTTLLAVGSSRNIIFTGGPLPWNNKAKDYFQRIELSNKDIVEIIEDNLIKDIIGKAVFKVICRSLGTTTLTYTISNIPLLPNCKPSHATEKIEIICGKPRYIYLQPEFKNNKNCPLSHNAEKIMAHSDNHLKILVIIKDKDGRQFDNITSLNIEWNLQPSSSGSVQISSSTIEETFSDMDVILPRNYYQNVIFKKSHGTLTVFATVTGYQKYILSKLKITPEWPPFPIENDKGGIKTPLIEASTEISLVNDTIINPNNLMILNDPNMKFHLQVSQGSGYYELILSTSEVADIKYMDTTRMISVIPKKPGLVSLTLIDRCLSSEPTEAYIEVQQLALIEIDTITKIEKGKSVIAALKLYDTNGNIIKLPSLNALDFIMKFDDEYIQIKELPSNEQATAPYDKILYKIHGMSEGESELTFFKKDDYEIQSETITIQVFHPLRVQPKNLTILIGTIYQIQTTGGPTNAEIEFSTGNNDILHIDRNGIFEGRLAGRTKVHVRAVGFNAKGSKILYSEDHADIYVLYLDGVKISTPVSRVKVGATFPLWAFGIPDYLTPLIIGSMQLPLNFVWSLSDPNLLSLHNMYAGTRINIRYQNQVSLRAKAVNPGIVTIYLNVTIPSDKLRGFKNDIAYNTFVKIEIFEELHLINPTLIDNLPLILMSPNSVLRLQTNRDKHGLTTYKILSNVYNNETENSNVLTTGDKTVTVDKTGLVKSGDNLGQTIISITNTEAYNLKQSTKVIIEVKPIHYMMLSLKSNLHIRNGEELNMLPKGMELDYIAEYYDIIGNKFHAVETNVKTMLNRGDLASFTINSDNVITAKFFENGELVMKVFNEKYPNGIFDYVYMMIDDIMFPTKTSLTVGDIICFSMPLLSFDGNPGYWQSSAPELLSVDPITGIGRARSVGHVMIKHSLATHIQGEIEVNILPLSKVSIVPSRAKNITGMEIYSVPLVLKSKDEEIKENNVLARGLGGCRTLSSFSLNSFPYTCNIRFISSLASSISIKDLFITRPRFDIVTGFYYCDIIPMRSHTIASSISESRIQIYAQSQDIESAALELHYLPPVYIEDKEITFIISQNQEVSITTFEVYGLPYVLEHLIIDVPDGIAVTWQSHICKSIMQYKLRLMHDHDEIQGQKIYIASELTKQNISLYIRISRYNGFIPLSGIQWVDYMYFHRYTFGTFALVVITIFYIYKNKCANVNLTVGNRNIFVEKYPPMIRKVSTPNTSTSSSPSSHSPFIRSPLRPFSAFDPVYGDPRGFGTPYIRRTTKE